MEGIIDLHHDIMFFIILIVILVAFLLFEFTGLSKFKALTKVINKETNFENGIFKLSNSKVESNFLLPSTIQHNTILEIVWTIIPCLILLLIAIPSFSLLYAIEDLSIIESTVKIIGNQ